MASSWGAVVSWGYVSLPQPGTPRARQQEPGPVGEGRWPGRLIGGHPIPQLQAGVGSYPPPAASTRWHLPCHSQLWCLLASPWGGLAKVATVLRLQKLPTWPRLCHKLLCSVLGLGMHRTPPSLLHCPWSWVPQPARPTCCFLAPFHPQGPWPLKGWWALPVPPLAAESAPCGERTHPSPFLRGPPCPFAPLHHAQQPWPGI